MSAAPRVLVLGLKWPPETFIKRLLDGLTGRGVRITVAVAGAPAGDLNTGVAWLRLPAATSRAGELWQVGRALVDLARRSPGEVGPLLRTGRKSGSATGVVATLRRDAPLVGRDFDVMYFPWNTTAIAYQSLLDRAPAVISCRGSHINVAPHNPERADLREGLATTFDRAAAVHCVSAHIRDEATRYGLDASRAVVIRPAVDPDIFRPAGTARPDGPLRIITTGSIIWRKGYEYALLAIRALIDGGIAAHFDIIGGGPEEQRLLYTIHDLSLQDHVTWHGPQPPQTVVRHLQSADVFLLTSLSEGIANAVLEGMACGLPVVTTGVGGMPEAVTDGVEGFLVPERDPVATAAALARLATSPQLRRNMGAAARRRVEQDFRLDNQVDAFADLFRAVAS